MEHLRLDLAALDEGLGVGPVDVHEVLLAVRKHLLERCLMTALVDLIHERPGPLESVLIGVGEAERVERTGREPVEEVPLEKLLPVEERRPRQRHLCARAGIAPLRLQIREHLRKAKNGSTGLVQPVIELDRVDVRALGIEAREIGVRTELDDRRVSFREPE